MHQLYLLLRGPLALISFIVFIGGVIYQIIWFFNNTKVQEIPKNPGLLPSKKEIKSFYPPEDIKKLTKWEGSVWSTQPYFTILTSIFHILVILTPIFLLAHNILIKQSWGIAPPSLSEKITDVFTIVVLCFGAYFLYRRIFLSKVRIITGGGDWLMFFLVFLPYLTGFLAYHQIFPYMPMVILHMFLGELMLVCIPFTRLKHMIFFFLNRFYLKSEYSFFKKGNRVWN
ncbi:TmcC family electron transfer complex membrane anchor subunit [Desulfothermus sp.]